MTSKRWMQVWRDRPRQWRAWLDSLPQADSGWLRVEQVREDDDLVIKAELPGIDPENDVVVEVVDGILRIAAKREQRSEHHDKNSTRSEFRYGEFVRELPLPAGVQQSSVKARYRDGILEVRVPWPAGHIDGSTRTKVAVTRS